MTTVQCLILVLFLICAAVDILAVRNGSAAAERAAKPLLMPLLLVFYLVSVPKPDLFLALALACGFLGDTFLLGSGVFFLCGLASFLAGHIFYISVFLRPLAFSAVPPAFFLLALPYIVYGILACRKLFPSLQKKDKPAIVLYLVCLLAMSFSSLLRFQGTGGLPFWLPFGGSLLFVASDTRLAFQVFQKPSGKNSGVAVMITYLLAQLMIVLGFVL